MSDRDDAIERVRERCANAPAPADRCPCEGCAGVDDVAVLLAAYDEAIAHQAKLEADLYEQDANAARLVAKLTVSRESLEMVSEERDEALRLYDALCDRWR